MRNKMVVSEQQTLDFTEKPKAFIYGIRNKLTDKYIYVGSTKHSIEHRYNQHVTKIKRGSHENKHLQHLMLQDRIDNFAVELIEIVDEEIRANRETYWIGHHKDTLVNIQKIASSYPSHCETVCSFLFLPPDVEIRKARLVMTLVNDKFQKAEWFINANYGRKFIVQVVGWNSKLIQMEERLFRVLFFKSLRLTEKEKMFGWGHPAFNNNRCRVAWWEAFGYGAQTNN